MKESLQDATQKALLESYKNSKKNKFKKTENKISKARMVDLINEMFFWLGEVLDEDDIDGTINAIGVSKEEFEGDKDIPNGKLLDVLNKTIDCVSEHVSPSDERDTFKNSIGFTDEEMEELYMEFDDDMDESELEESKVEDDEDENEILIKFWETEEDRDLGYSEIYKYFDISELKHAISIARDLLFDMSYASVEVQDAKTYETYYFTDGEEEKYFGIAKDLKESKKLESYNYYWKDDIEEVENTEENDELVYNIAEHMKETQPEEYEDYDVWDIASNIIHVWKILKRSRLYDYLIKWYGSEQEMLNKVRDVYETRDAIYFVTGSGYSLFDADLLGGNADGRTAKAFDEFVENGGNKKEITESNDIVTINYRDDDAFYNLDKILELEAKYNLSIGIKQVDGGSEISITGKKDDIRAFNKEYNGLNAEDISDADLLGRNVGGRTLEAFGKFVANGGKKEEKDGVNESKNAEQADVKSALKNLNVSTFDELRDAIEEMLEKEIINEEYEDFLDIISEKEDACEDYIRRRSDVTNTDLEDEIGIESDYVTDAIQDLIGSISLTESKKVEEDLNGLYEKGTSELEKAFKTEVTYWLQSLADENSNDDIGQKALSVLDDESKLIDIVSELVNGSDDMWSEIHLRIEELAGINYRNSIRANESCSKVTESKLLPVKDLPDMCYGVLPSDNSIIVIKRGEDGYYETDLGSPENVDEVVDSMNEKMGVTPEQRYAMEIRSMYNNWNEVDECKKVEGKDNIDFESLYRDVAETQGGNLEDKEFTISIDDIKGAYNKLSELKNQYNVAGDIKVLGIYGFGIDVDKDTATRLYNEMDWKSPKYSQVIDETDLDSGVICIAKECPEAGPFGQVAVDNTTFEFGYENFARLEVTYNEI